MESLRASGPGKPGNIRGESELSPRMIPWLSPDALHPDRRLSPQAQSSQVRFMRTLLVSPDFIADEIPATGGHRRFIRRARSTTAPSQTSASHTVSAGIDLIRSVKLHPLNGSRGRSPLVQVHEGRTGPRFVVNLLNMAANNSEVKQDQNKSVQDTERAPEAAPPEPRDQGLLLDLFRVVLHGVVQHFLGGQIAHEHHLDIGLQFLFKGSFALEFADDVHIVDVFAGQGV